MPVLERTFEYSLRASILIGEFDDVCLEFVRWIRLETKDSGRESNYSADVFSFIAFEDDESDGEGG